jgi:F0F1-type ATP synthase membrane subunit b/b'
VGSQITSIIDQAKANASNIEQSIQASAQNASSNAESQAQDFISGFQKNVSDAISAAKEAEPKIQACLKNQSDEYKKVLESTSKYKSGQTSNGHGQITYSSTIGQYIVWPWAYRRSIGNSVSRNS